MIWKSFRILTAAVLLGTVFLTAPSSRAADELTASSPEDGATLGMVPESVDLTFDDAIDPETVQIVVIAPNGARADSGATETTGDGVRSVQLQAGLGNGDYLVYWLIGSPGKRADAFGDLAFSVEGASPCQPASDATPRPPAEECLADPPSGPPGEAIQSNGVSVTLAISSDQAGPVDLAATVVDESGAPVDAVVWFRARHLEMNHGELPYLAAQTSPGVYEASFVGMGMGGRWRVAVDVVLPGQPPITVFIEQMMVE